MLRELRGFAIALPLLAAVPFILPSFRSLSVAITALLYAIILYGFSTLYGEAGLLSIAHGALWGIGAYTCALLIVDQGVSFWLALLAGTALTALLAAVLGYPSLRVPGHYFLIVTFGFAVLIQAVLNNWTSLTGGSQGIIVVTEIQGIGPLHFDSLRGMYYLVLAFVVLSAIFAACIRAARMGRLFRGLRESEPLSAAVGLNVNAYKVLAFTISGLYAGASGALYAVHTQFLDPTSFGPEIGIALILMLIFGGARSLLGPLVGAGAIAFIPEVLDFDPVLSSMMYGVALIVVILLLPDGVVGGISRGAAALVRRWQDRRIAQGSTAAVETEGERASS